MEEVIDRFVEVKDYGYSNGNGDGDGNGYGYGDGSGYVDGDGSGDGYGDGNGDGDGYGDGYGDGSGYVDGNGDGYGNGDGNALMYYNSQRIHCIDKMPTLIDFVHNNYARGHIVNKDLTLTPCYIAKVGNYFAHGSTLRQAFNDATDKHEESMSVEEKVGLFYTQYPDADMKVSADELFRWHGKLTGSCELGRKAFCANHEVDIKSEYTIRQFIELTTNAYGGDVIKLLAEKY